MTDREKLPQEVEAEIEDAVRCSAFRHAPISAAIKIARAQVETLTRRIQELEARQENVLTPGPDKPRIA